MSSPESLLYIDDTCNLEELLPFPDTEQGLAAAKAAIQSMVKHYRDRGLPNHECLCVVRVLPGGSIEDGEGVYAYGDDTDDEDNDEQDTDDADEC